MTAATARAREALNKLPGGWLDEVTAPQLIVDLLAEVRAARVQGMREAVKIAAYIAQNYDVMDSTGTRYMPPKTQVAAKSMLRIAIEDITAAADALEREQSYE